MRFWKRSLLSKLIILILFSSLATTGLVGLITYERAKEALKLSVLERLEVISAAMENEISYWVDSQSFGMAQDRMLDSQTGERMEALAAHFTVVRLGGLGQGDKVYLVNKAGELVASIGPAALAEGLTQELFHTGEVQSGGRLSSEGIDTALQGQNGQGLYLDYEGKPVIGVYRWIEEPELALVVEIHQEKAFAPARQLAGIALGVGLALAVMLTGGGYLIVRRIVQPILVIANTANEVVGSVGRPSPNATEADTRRPGDLSHVAAVAGAAGPDEIRTLTLAFNKMSAQLRALSTNLEAQVAERTRELKRRLDQMEIGMEIGQAASQELDPGQLVQVVVELIGERFGLYYTAIFVVDESKRYAVLQAGTGKAGRIMLERSQRLEIGGKSMVGWACANKRAQIAVDVGEESVRFANPLLPKTRSEMALPLCVGERVIGALDIQSELAQAFNEKDVIAFQAMADQIAVALENAFLFQQVRSNLEELELANRLLSEQSWRDFLRSRPVDFAEFHQPESEPFTPEKVSEASRGEQRTSSQGELVQETHGGTMARPGEARQADVMYVPLKIRDQIIGTLIAERAADQPKWSTLDYELLEAVANQVTQSIDSTRLFEASQRHAAQERLMSELTARMRESPDVEMVIETAVREMSKALGLAAIEVRLVTDPMED